LAPALERSSTSHGRIFLSTEWRDLLMLNYQVEPAFLQPFVPRGTELDSFDGKTYVSLVGLRFARTKLFGSISVPFHSNFDEVNLRIYVRRTEQEEVRRGVVFIREIVSLPAVTFIARTVYAENYVTLPLRHSIDLTGTGGQVEYAWNSGRDSFRMHARASGSPSPAGAGSLEQFVAEHYWGYTQRRDGSAREYHVSHEPWGIWHATKPVFEGDGSRLYGAQFGRALARPPDSAFIANGSPVLVFSGRRIQ
jgi:uncharacterized protein